MIRHSFKSIPFCVWAPAISHLSRFATKMTKTGNNKGSEENSQLWPHPSATFTDIASQTININSAGEDISSKFREHRSKVSILVLASLMLATCIVQAMADSKNRILQIIALLSSLGLAFFAYQWIFRFSDELTTQGKRAAEPLVVMSDVQSSYQSSTMLSLAAVEEVRSQATQQDDEAKMPPPDPLMIQCSRQEEAESVTDMSTSNSSLMTTISDDIEEVRSETTQQDDESRSPPKDPAQKAYTPPGSPILRSPLSPPDEMLDYGGNSRNGYGNGPGENADDDAMQHVGDFDYGTSLSIGVIAAVIVTSANEFLTGLLRWTGP